MFRLESVVSESIRQRQPLENLRLRIGVDIPAAIGIVLVAVAVP
jgi:hypothetical protein